MGGQPNGQSEIDSPEQKRTWS